MGPKRIAALRRLVEEHRVGLARTNDADMIRLVDELLDEVELLRTLFIRKHFGHDTAAGKAALATFEDVF